jgi:hypothetical protein
MCCRGAHRTCGTCGKLGGGDADGTAFAASRDFHATADVVGNAVLGEAGLVVSADQATMPSHLEPITAYHRHP